MENILTIFVIGFLVLPRLELIFYGKNKRALTGCAALGAGDVPVELPVSSLFNLAVGFEKDLKMSDCSRFKVAGLLGGLLSG
jgi:hypothetical protein